MGTERQVPRSCHGLLEPGDRRAFDLQHGVKVRDDTGLVAEYAIDPVSGTSSEVLTVDFGLPNRAFA